MRWFRDRAWLDHAERRAAQLHTKGLEVAHRHGYVVVGGHLGAGSVAIGAWLEGRQVMALLQVLDVLAEGAK